MLSTQGLSCKSTAWLLFVLVGATALVRLCIGPITLTGNFSSYQTIFGMIAKRYEANHFHNIWNPEFFMIQEGKPGLELIFFPLVSLAAALLRWWMGGDMDFWGRLVSVFATTANVLVLYRIARFELERTPSLFAAFLFAFSPYVWVYGRNFQNEALALLFLCLSLYGILCSGVGRRRTPAIIASALCLGVAAALRIHFLLLAPGFLTFFSQTQRLREKLLWCVCVPILPFVWHYHAWTMQNLYPQVHTTMVIQLQAGKTFPHPYLGQWQYYVRFLKDIAGWAVGPVGFLCVLSALWGSFWARPRRKWLALLVLSWAVVLLIPQKFMTQHFYAYASVLPMSILGAIGLRRLTERFSPKILWVMLPVVLISSIGVGFRPAYTVSPADRCLAQAAAFIRNCIPEGDLVIASHGSTGDLLYYSDHLGWTYYIHPHLNRPFPPEMLIQTRGGLPEKDLEERNEAYRNSVDWLEYLRKKGAKWFVVSDQKALEMNPALKDHLDSHYRLACNPSERFCAYQLSLETN